MKEPQNDRENDLVTMRTLNKGITTEMSVNSLFIY